MVAISNMPYNMGRPIAPYVDREASIQRAVKESRDGTYKKRRDIIEHIVRASWLQGLTWSELSELLDLHHGQVSGVLSVLHDDGILVALAKTRLGSHPYIHKEIADHFNESDLIRRPAKTKARRNRDIVDAACELLWALDCSIPPMNDEQINAIETLRSAINNSGL